MDKGLLTQALVKFFLGVILLGALIFLPAWSLHYWQGWLLMGILFVPMFVVGLVGAAGFLNVTIHRDEYTYALNRQVEVIALVRSFRPIPVDEFDRIARPLIL